jgi:hypothetical protein
VKHKTTWISGSSLGALLALWLGTAFFGPSLVLRHTLTSPLSPLGQQRIQEAYNEEDRVSALVREGLLKPPAYREDQKPQLEAHRVACPIPLILDAEITYRAYGKSRTLTNGRYLFTPWRIYLLNER